MESDTEPELPSLRPAQPGLISEGEGPGPTGPVGFLPDPPEAHVRKAAEALARVAEAVSTSNASLSEQKIALRHFRWDPLLARSLFGFSVYDFDAVGGWIDPFAPGRRLNYAIAVNQSVELQVEVALVFLHQVAFRHRKLMEMKAAGEQIHLIDVRMAQEDAEAKREVADRLRYGWKAVVETVQLRMTEAGLSPVVEYTPNLIDDVLQLRRRIPHLRRLYNNIDSVRECVDKLVSMAGRDDPRLAARGSTAVRDWMQQQTQLWRLRFHQNQALRDAEVCGNGFLAFSLREPLGLFNFRSEEMTVDAAGTWRPDRSISGFDPNDVMHLPGSRQISSGYGVSILEPLLPSLRTLDVFEAASEFAQHILEDRQASDENREWAANTQLQTQRVREQTLAAVSQILWFPLNHLPKAAENLYFPGHELMR